MMTQTGVGIVPEAGEQLGETSGQSVYATQMNARQTPRRTLLKIRAASVPPLLDSFAEPPCYSHIPWEPQ